MRFTREQYEQLVARTHRDCEHKSSSPAKCKEEELQKQCIEYCISKGWLVMSSRSDQSTGRPKGEPDLQILQPHGKSVWIELKVKGGKLSTEQVAMQAHLKFLGQQVFTVWNFDEFLNAVNSETKTNI